jgi:TatD DNase family protein
MASVFVDSHCHLTFPELHGRVDAIRADMAAASVDRALVICTTLEEFPRVHELAVRFDNFWASAGVHPDNDEVEEPTVERLVGLAAFPRWGHRRDRARLLPPQWRTREQMHWQRERLRVHVRAARQVRKPLIVHTRSASEDTLAVLREEGAQDAGGVFHCFTETMHVARAALDLGFMVSFSGILTFRNAEELREVARLCRSSCLIPATLTWRRCPPQQSQQPAWVPCGGKLAESSRSLERGQVTSRISPVVPVGP